MERNKEAGGKEPAPTRGKQANLGEALGIFILPAWLLLQLCFPQLSSAARLPPSSLPSPIKCLPTFSSLHCAQECFPQSFTKLLVLSFRFLSQTQLLLGAYKILADYQAFGGGHVCTHVCALKEKGLFWHEIYGVYFGHVICNHFLYLHVVSELYSCTASTCVHGQGYNVPCSTCQKVSLGTNMLLYL